MPTTDSLTKLTLPDLQDAFAMFEQRVEKPGGPYDMARGLFEKGCEIEGCVLFLATWNTGCFRFVKNFHPQSLRDAWKELASQFALLKEQNIQSIDISTHRDTIAKTFTRLSEVSGVLYTGAAKLMHLKLPSLFVPWDEYIRGEKAKRYYDALHRVAPGKWYRLRYPYLSSGEGYLSFLRDMQNRVRDLSYPVDSKPLAKAIDEFNFVNVTLPIQNQENEEREKKRLEEKKKRLEEKKRKHEEAEKLD
ncbi:MAG TPA: hypothetical protein VI636_02215 [Candidatus Angelobacter sp.]